MTLSSAINTAQSIFTNTGTQSSVISKNIENVGNPNYARRAAVLSTTLYGAAVVTTERAQDAALLRQTLSSSAFNSGQQALLTGLERLSNLMGGNNSELSPASYIVKLQEQLQTYASKSNDATVGATVIAAAQDVALSLNEASAGVQSVRTQADRDIELAVNKLNDLLRQFKTANDKINELTSAQQDPNDALDVREGLLKQISEIVGVSTVMREPNDMVLFTSDGTTLFETSPRTVTFNRTSFFGAATTGNSVYIDGVAVNAGTGANSTASGSLQGLLQLRDDAAPMFQTQLDEIARGLVQVFSETSNGLPATTATGLFTWSGGTVPASGTVVPGISATISVASVVIPSLGGDPTRLRDGAINGAAFTKNPSGNSGYSALLDGYATGLDAPMAFDPAAQLEISSGLLSFSTKSIGWLEAQRSGATNAGEVKNAMLTRANDAYSNATGVNLDEEMSLMLDIEQSYKASAKLLSTIDEMLKALMDAA